MALRWIAYLPIEKGGAMCMIARSFPFSPLNRFQDTQSSPLFPANRPFFDSRKTGKKFWNLKSLEKSTLLG
jgi:hypothetical protein